jgi:hypothetical protein
MSVSSDSRHAESAPKAEPPDSTAAIGFNAPAEADKMATITLQESTRAREIKEDGDAEMYHADLFSGVGGGVPGEDGSGLAPGGAGPLPRRAGQPYLRGGWYPGPPAGPPGGRGPPGRGPPGGGDAAPQVNPALPIGQPSPQGNGSLKGTTPTIFDGNRKNTRQFTQEFTLYRMINQDAVTMKNVYTQTALTLFFMRGPAINDWVQQQTDKLYLKCNGNALNGFAPTYHTNNKHLWVEFRQEFC